MKMFFLGFLFLRFFLIVPPHLVAMDHLGTTENKELQQVKAWSTLEAYRKIIDELIENNASAITRNYGEPFLHYFKRKQNAQPEEVRAMIQEFSLQKKKLVKLGFQNCDDNFTASTTNRLRQMLYASSAKIKMWQIIEKIILSTQENIAKRNVISENIKNLTSTLENDFLEAKKERKKFLEDALILEGEIHAWNFFHTHYLLDVSAYAPDISKKMGDFFLENHAHLQACENLYASIEYIDNTLNSKLQHCENLLYEIRSSLWEPLKKFQKQEASIDTILKHQTQKFLKKKLSDFKNLNNLHTLFNNQDRKYVLEVFEKLIASLASHIPISFLKKSSQKDAEEPLEVRYRNPSLEEVQQQIDLYTKCFILYKISLLYSFSLEGPSDSWHCERLEASAYIPTQHYMNTLSQLYDQRERDFLKKHSIHSWLLLDLRIKALEAFQTTADPSMMHHYKPCVDDAIAASQQSLLNPEFMEIFQIQTQFMLRHTLMQQLKKSNPENFKNYDIKDAWTDNLTQGIIDKKMLQRLTNLSSGWEDDVTRYIKTPEGKAWLREVRDDIKKGNYPYLDLKYQPTTIPEQAAELFHKALDVYCQKHITDQIHQEVLQEAGPIEKKLGILQPTAIAFSAVSGLALLTKFLKSRTKVVTPEAHETDEIDDTDALL